MNRLAIIIPTYNNLPMLRRLVNQLYKNIPDFRLYIIEDGQRLPTIKYLMTIEQMNSHNCTVIFHRSNEGVAKSWNDGITQAIEDGCTHFAIINDDIEVKEDFWQKCEPLFLENHLVSLDEPCPIPIVTGWFFILDRIAVKTVGLFDSQFSPYTSEDMDYSIRYQQSGLNYAKIKLNVVHHGGVTTGKIRKRTPEKFKAAWNDNWSKLRTKYPNLKMVDQTI